MQQYIKITLNQVRCNGCSEDSYIGRLGNAITGCMHYFRNVRREQGEDEHWLKRQVIRGSDLVYALTYITERSLTEDEVKGSGPYQDLEEKYEAIVGEIKKTSEEIDKRGNSFGGIFGRIGDIIGDGESPLQEEIMKALNEAREIINQPYDSE